MRLRCPRTLVHCTLVALSLAIGSELSAAEVKWDPIRVTPPETIQELAALQDNVKRVVEKCTPATVGIIIFKSSEAKMTLEVGAGSGVIVSEDGLVLTVAHVTGEPGQDCQIVLQNGKRVKGKTLGRNEKLDYSMIKITDKGPNEGKWPFVNVGKSADLKKGQWVVALGHPNGPKSGRPPVARLGRIQTLGKEQLTTDCVIVGGDSGGPLFDLNGDVIACHTQINADIAVNVHAPAALYQADWEKLVRGDQIGKPIKPANVVLGVTFDEDAADARVKLVTEDSPAAAAGFKEGDVITSFDGVKITTVDEIRLQLRKKKAGEEVDVVVKRGTKTLTLTVTLTKRT